MLKYLYLSGSWALNTKRERCLLGVYPYGFLLPDLYSFVYTTTYIVYVHVYTDRPHWPKRFTQPASWLYSYLKKRNKGKLDNLHNHFREQQSENELQMATEKSI